jgi:hypothetical protein
MNSEASTDSGRIPKSEIEVYSDLMETIHQAASHSYPTLDDPGYLDAFLCEREEQRARLPLSLARKSDQSLPLALIGELSNEFDIQWIQPPDLTVVFDAVHLLAWLVWTWKNCQKFNPLETRVLNLLQKRFEVHHRLFDRYDGEIRRQGDNFEDARVYILLAVALLLRFWVERNYNDLNTALKLHDVLLKAKWNLDSLCQRWLSHSLRLEGSVLRSERAH